MARYIDADRLIAGLELSIKSWSADSNSNAPTMVVTYQDVLHRVKNLPTADVVPKSEVSETVEKLMSATDKVICEAKAEVAREIFEEIERTLDNYHHSSLLAGEIYPISYYDAELEDAIAELEKKYTEDKE